VPPFHRFQPGADAYPSGLILKGANMAPAKGSEDWMPNDLPMPDFLIPNSASLVSCGYADSSITRFMEKWPDYF